MDIETSIDALKEKELIRNRIELICITILYPTWSIFLKLFIPDAFDILWQRFVIGGLFMALLLGTFFSEFIRKHLNLFFYTLVNILYAHFFFLIYKSSFSPIYVVGCMVVASVVSIVNFQLISYLALCLNALACTVLIIFFTAGNRDLAAMLVLGLSTIHFTNFLILRSRLRTESQLKDARDLVEKKNKDLIANLALTTIQKKDLEKVNKELDRYVHTVSHDIRSPLMGISGYTDLLHENMKADLSPKRERFFKGIFSGISHLNIMIDDLLRTTKMTRIQNPYEPVDINTLIDTVKNRIDFKINDLHVDLRIQPDLPTLSCDRIKLTEIFQNLLVNAIKFSTTNDTPPRVEITYQERAHDHEFCVKDNGIGIDPKHHQQIFEMFESADSSGKYDGSGLGLNIVQKLIYDHGGRIWVESKEWAGAAFYFTIPKVLHVG